MKNYAIFYTEAADRDIRSIYEYIAFSLKEPHIAGKTVNRILKEVVSLESMPLRHPSYENPEYDLHTLSIGNYIVFYSVDEPSGSVFIIRVMYGGRDFDEQF